MLFTPIRIFFYALWLACILSGQFLAYSQAHNLSPYPVAMLLVLMEEESSAATNTKPASDTNKPFTGTGNNQVQGGVTNEAQSSNERAAAVEDPEDPKVSKLKALIIEESKKAGLIKGIVNGTVILYSSMSDLVLHPVLTAVLVILVIGLILFIVFIILALKRENFDLMNKLLIFGGFLTVLFIDLLFVLYEQRKITIKFFSFDKDILLVISSAVIGYFIGRYFSRQIFEEKALP